MFDREPVAGNVTSPLFHHFNYRQQPVSPTVTFGSCWGVWPQETQDAAKKGEMRGLTEEDAESAETGADLFSVSSALSAVNSSCGC